MAGLLAYAAEHFKAAAQEAPAAAAGSSGEAVVSIPEPAEPDADKAALLKRAGDEVGA